MRRPSNVTTIIYAPVLSIPYNTIAMAATLLHRCLEVAVEAARQAGRLQARAIGRPSTVATKSSAIDLVTDVDRTSERLIRKALTRHFPTHGLYGEEHGRANPRAPYQWFIDPLDGTMNFVHGVPWFTVSIGLVHQHQPVVGVIYDPIQEELFTAVHGGGARLNGRRIRVSRTRRLKESLLSTGFSSQFHRHAKRYLGWFEQLQRRSHGVRRVGSTALSLAYVACGRFDGFYEHDLWPWDIAAGMVLVSEAGGCVTDFDGRPLPRPRRGLLLASNGAIHHELIPILAA